MNAMMIIPLNGLPAGKTRFSWQAGKEFFAEFDNSDILDADLSVEAIVEKSGTYLGVDLRLGGGVTVQCDRCLEDLEIEVDELVPLTVKFGDEPDGAESSENGREIIYLQGEPESIDLSQTVYDYACLAVPMHHVHEDGSCNPEAMKYLSQESGESQEHGTDNNPFAALKGLFDN